MATVSLKNVKKKFGSTEVIQGISTDIKDGEFIVIVGPSGCGKSTLLRMIAGLETVTEGEIFIDEDFVNEKEPMDRDIAMVFQNYALYPHMSVRQNMGYGLKIAKMPKDQIDAKVVAAAKLLQLEPLLDRRPKQLSGGQRQRVAMGRAIVRQPQLFLFDEPLSNLDAKLRVEMRTEIKKLHKRLGTTIVYVTHDQIEAMTLADRIAVMKDGIVQQLGAPDEIYNDPANMFVAGFMGSPPMNFIEADVVDGNVVIETAGQQYQMRMPCAEGIRASGKKRVVLGIRPEMITEPKPQEESDWLHSIVMDIEVVEPMGADTMALALWNGTEINARLSPKAGKSAGKGTPIQVNTHLAVAFDPATGERIR